MNRAGIVKRLAAAVLVCSTIALSGCASGSTVKRDPNTIVQVIRTDGATMNPLLAQGVEDGLVYAQLLFESLTYIGADYLPHPRLATSWTHTPDGLHWTVDLRRGVRWSDGVPFTSRDVVFTYDAIRDPNTAAPAIGDFVYIKNVRALGPYRVRFDLTIPSAVFVLTAMGVEASILPEHILGNVPHIRWRGNAFSEHPVGTGPYELERWSHDSETVFVRNPYAWRQPHINRLDFHTIFDDQADADALASGSADLYDDTGSTIYQQLKKMAPHLVFMTFPSVYVDVTQINVRRPGLRDVIVRRAMMYGQDRKSLVDGFFNGLVPVPDGLIPAALTHWHTSDVRQYPYDPARANAMLDADGWRIGPDGVRRRGNTRLSFEYLLNPGSPILTATVLAFVADMKLIGIEVRLRQLDFPSMLQREYDGKFDLIGQGFGGGTDPDLTENLSTSAIPPNGGNYGGFSDPALDKLMHAGLIELNDRKRQLNAYEVQRRVADSVPIFYQFGRFAGLVHATRLILDPKTTLQSPLLYYNVEDWKVAQ